MPGRPSAGNRVSALGVVRVAAVAALVIAIAAVAVSLLGGAGSYTVHAQFVNAGQLVNGNLVQVAGQTVGKIKKITLSDDGLANLELTIDEDRYTPLHRGTIAKIRTPGLSAVTGRYVELSPGPQGAKEIDDGGVIEPHDTEPIVDLDSVLNAIEPDVRQDLQDIIGHGKTLVEGNAQDFNRALATLNPATAQIRALTAEVVRDQPVLRRLIDSSATVARAFASRSPDVEQGIANTAGTFQAIAAERDALERSLVRAPGVLEQARGTLAGVRSTLDVVRPALREARPVAPRLTRFLREFVPTARLVTPVVARIREILPPLRRVLEQTPALASVGVPALRSLTSAAKPLVPILGDIRPYATDLAYGFFGGLGGATGGGYDANGHFARILPEFATQKLLSQGLTQLVDGVDLPSFSGYATGRTARCPGSAVEPAADGSNPYIPDPSICDPSHGVGRP